MRAQQHVNKFICTVLGLAFWALPGAAIGFVLGTALDLWIASSKSDKQNPKKAASQPTFSLRVSLKRLFWLIASYNPNYNQLSLDKADYILRNRFRYKQPTKWYKSPIPRKRDEVLIDLITTIRINTDDKIRVYILRSLAEIIRAGKRHLSNSDIEFLKKIGRRFYLQEQILNMLLEGERDTPLIKRSYSHNWYRTLGLSGNENLEMVKKRYRDLVKVHHPDRQAGKSELQIQESSRKFREIQQAYEMIVKLKSA